MLGNAFVHDAVLSVVCAMGWVDPQVLVGDVPPEFVSELDEVADEESEQEANNDNEMQEHEQDMQKAMHDAGGQCLNSDQKTLHYILVGNIFVMVGSIFVMVAWVPY